MVVTAPELRRPSLYRRVVDYARDLWGRREFVWFLAVGNLKSQHATTTLGVVWYVINPLLLAGVYFFVFGVLFAGTRRGDPEFLAYLVSGMFVFHFTSRTMNSGANTILGNSKLMVNLKFPRLLLPISSLLEAAIGFLVSIAVFFLLIMPIAQTRPTWTLVMFIPILLIQIVMNLGLGCLVARLTLPYRDVGNLLPYLTRMWLYLSPIIWTIDDPRFFNAPDWAKTLVELNPLYYFLNVYRGALMGELFSFTAADVAIAAGFAATVAFIGITLFVRFEGKMVQYL